jgi:hypothetical protein
VHQTAKSAVSQCHVGIAPSFLPHPSGRHLGRRSNAYEKRMLDVFATPRRSRLRPPTPSIRPSRLAQHALGKSRNRPRTGRQRGGVDGCRHCRHRRGGRREAGRGEGADRGTVAVFAKADDVQNQLKVVQASEVVATNTTANMASKAACSVLLALL